MSGRDGASAKADRAAAATQSSPQAVLSKADIPSAEIGRLIDRILELAPSAGLYVEIAVKPAGPM